MSPNLGTFFIDLMASTKFFAHPVNGDKTDNGFLSSTSETDIIIHVAAFYHLRVGLGSDRNSDSDRNSNSDSYSNSYSDSARGSVNLLSLASGLEMK